MPFCPKCKSEYEQGIQQCADCSCDLISELPKPMNEPSNYDISFKLLLRTSLQEAEFIRIILSNAGIHCNIQGENAVSMLPMDYGMGGFYVDIYVPYNEFLDATRIIEEQSKNKKKYKATEQSGTEVEKTITLLKNKARRIMWYSIASFFTGGILFPLALIAIKDGIIWFGEVEGKKTPIPKGYIVAALILSIASLIVPAVFIWLIIITMRDTL